MSGGMICAFAPCRKPVTAGRMVEVHRVGDAEVVFGDGIAGYPLAAADGALLRRYHGLCWWAQVKRDRLAERARLAAAGPADRPGHPGDAEDQDGGLGGDYREAGTAPV